MILHTRKSIIKLLALCLSVVVLGLCSFLSYATFGVANPFRTAAGLAQVLWTQCQYVEIGRNPRVVVAKPGASLSAYMQQQGFHEEKDKQMGAMLVFSNPNTSEYVVYSQNKYYARWLWA